MKPAPSKSKDTSGQSITSSYPPSTYKSFVKGRRNDIVIPLMGATKAGKSTMTNLLCNAEIVEVANAEDLESCTAKIQAIVIEEPPPIYRGLISILSGRRVIIVDTPGFDDTHKGDEEILARISNWLKTSYERDILVGGVLYLHDISRDGWPKSSYKNLHLFEKLCGKDSMYLVKFVTTKWDYLQSPMYDAKQSAVSVGEGRVNQLRKKFWAPLLERGATTHNLRPRDASKAPMLAEDPWEIIHQVVVDMDRRDVRKRVLQIQDELVNQERYLNETAAGRELRLDMQKLLKTTKEIEREAKKNARKGLRDDELLQKQQEIQSLKQQIEKLKLPPTTVRVKRFFKHLFGGTAKQATDDGDDALGLELARDYVTSIHQEVSTHPSQSLESVESRSSGFSPWDSSRSLTQRPRAGTVGSSEDAYSTPPSSIHHSPLRPQHASYEESRDIPPPAPVQPFPPPLFVTPRPSRMMAGLEAKPSPPPLPPRTATPPPPLPSTRTRTASVYTASTASSEPRKGLDLPDQGEHAVLSQECEGIQRSGEHDRVAQEPQPVEAEQTVVSFESQAILKDWFVAQRELESTEKIPSRRRKRAKSLTSDDLACKVSAGPAMRKPSLSQISAAARPQSSSGGTNRVIATQPGEGPRVGRPQVSIGTKAVRVRSAAQRAALELQSQNRG